VGEGAVSGQRVSGCPLTAPVRANASSVRAIDRHDVPETITIDKSGANTAPVNGLVSDSGVAIELRQSKYLNNLVEQDHRAMKRIVRPMLGFKDFDCARRLIAGIETMHMVKKGQLDCPNGEALSAADQFYSLAF